MTLNSKDEFENLFHTTISKCDLHEEAYSKTIYIDQSQFEDLIKFDLNFQPYISIAEDCGMSSITVMQSKTTHRFYIGFVNLAGHGPRYEVRPVRLKEMLNFEYIIKMLANHAQELDAGIDLKEKYEV